MPALPKRTGALVCVPLVAMGVAACGNTTSTAGFVGEQHEVAQTISNLANDVRAGEEQKVCTNDLANALVARLNAASGGCKQAIKNQLAEVESFEANVQSVQVAGTGTKRTATAVVKSVYEGKTVAKTVSLVKEGGAWKISRVA